MYLFMNIDTSKVDTTSVDTFVDTLVTSFYDEDDLPLFVDKQKFFEHQRVILLERLKSAKKINLKNRRIYPGPGFLMPVVCGYVDTGCSGIMDSLDEFYINVPPNIWENL